MLRLDLYSILLAAFSASAAASACMPPTASFAFASSQLSADGQSEVARVSEEARVTPGTRLKLTATHDATAKSLQMARKRVATIKEALARRGVPANRIDVEYVRTAREKARAVEMEIVAVPACG